MVIGKNALILIILKGYDYDVALIKHLAMLSDEELARESGARTLRKGYFVI